MPIRTNRGRAAVYRRLWGWPMRSPAHLAGTVAVLAVIAVAVGILLPRLLGDPDDGGTALTPAADRYSAGNLPGDDQHGALGATGTTLPTRLTEPLVTPSPTAPDPEALQVASTWAAAWVNHQEGMTEKAWLDGLAPYTTEEFLPVMETVRLASIPSSEVTGEPEAVSAHAKSVVAKVPTDGPDLLITVVDTDAGWRVAHYEQAG